MSELDLKIPKSANVLEIVAGERMPITSPQPIKIDGAALRIENTIATLRNNATRVCSH